MNTQRKTMENGLTGFWMRVDHKLSVKVVNGIMFRLPKGKSDCILTPILSPRFCRQIVASLLYQNGKFRLTVADKIWEGKHYGLFGLRRGSNQQGLANSTKSRKLKAQREQAAMSPSTYLNHPFSRLIGLKDGSAFDTVKAFHLRQNGKQTP